MEAQGYEIQHIVPQGNANEMASIENNQKPYSFRLKKSYHKWSGYRIKGLVCSDGGDKICNDRKNHLT